MSKPRTKIEDYAFIGDCHSGALVGRDGSIDWLCLPRFDSPALFAGLLGSEENGRWRIAPAGEEFRVARRYVEESMVLETTYETPTGSCRVFDFMLRTDSEPDLVRIVEGVQGHVELDLELLIRFEYGSVVPWVQRTGHHSFSATAGPSAVEFVSPVPIRNEDMRTRASFEVHAGEKLSFILTYHPSHIPLHHHIRHPWKLMEECVHRWNTWAAHCKVKGPAREYIVRSLLTLKALTYAPTGGMVAAPTTSLPESLDGSRNWDYRYCWIRDATLTLSSLLRGGFRTEAQAWIEWLVRAVAGTTDQLNIMYGIAGERRLTELEVDWLPGYADSKPVRIGNGASQQVQLDIFGGLMNVAWIAHENDIPFSASGWRVLAHLIEHLEKIWCEPDHGIWEVRGPKRHFTHSKMLAWVAFDRAVKLGEAGKMEGPIARWKEAREAIHEQVCKEAFDPKLNSFTQSYGSGNLDAALLRLPILGFLPIDDPRITGTIEAVEKHLLRDGFVERYRVSETEDGLSCGEGVFLPCSFWLVDVYLAQGRREEAEALFNRLLALRNDLGLLSEEYDPETKQMLGNFPQAFSLISVVNTAFQFDKHERTFLQKVVGL